MYTDANLPACVELVELYAPPSVNYGMIYPPAILVFIFTLTDSVISPLILIFGALYFTVGCECSFLLGMYSADGLFFRPRLQVQADLW